MCIRDRSITVRDFRGNWAFNSATQDFGGFEKFTQWLADDKLNRVGDPQFVNALAGDFHLRPGSPALTAGVDGKEVGAFGEAAEAVSYTHLHGGVKKSTTRF